jgi:hypothetical protein
MHEFSDLQLTKGWQRPAPRAAGTNEEKKCLRTRPAHGGRGFHFDTDTDFDFDEKFPALS